MLRVPPIQQPDEVTCLPTCIRAVLAYRGVQLSAADAAELCRTDHEGTVVDVALAGLAESGFDGELRQFRDVAELRVTADLDQPVIVIVRHPSRALHAVVVCQVDEEQITVMDPASGEYTTLPISRFEHLWGRVQNEGLVIGTRTASSFYRG